MPNLKSIGQVVREILQKTHFSPYFWYNFEVISQVKERKYQKSVQTRNIIQTFSFQKIKSEFDFHHLFGRYGCLKISTIRPILVLFPKYRENQIFPEHAVFAKMCPLSSFMILSYFERNLQTKFSVKPEKVQKMALFPKLWDRWIFFQKTYPLTFLGLPFRNSMQNFRKIRQREMP